MKDITNHFGTFYYPKSALVFYQKPKSLDTYIEFFDINKQGIPINAHPLTVDEAKYLKEFLTADEKKQSMKTQGILASNILSFDPNKQKVLWYCKSQRKKLLFTEKLGIPAGTASLPPLLWQADAHSLNIYALISNKRPTMQAKLYDAPFFNMYESGQVCMGNVEIQINEEISIEDFIEQWENYFFNSYFSHLIDNHNPIKGNCVSLWESLVNSTQAFPMDILKQSSTSLKELL